MIHAPVVLGKNIRNVVGQINQILLFNNVGSFVMKGRFFISPKNSTEYIV